MMRHILPTLITIVVIVLAYLAHDYISKAPRPPGADPWRDVQLHFWGVVFGLGVMALFWDLLFSAESFVRALIAPIVRAFAG